MRVLLLFVMLMTFVLGCSSTSEEAPTVTPIPAAATTPPDQPVELVIWAEGFTQDTMVIDPEGAGRYGLYLKNQFEAEYPNVTVIIEYQGWDEALRQNLFNAMLIGTAPDIVVGENYFQQFAALGALYPLDDTIADIQDNLIPGTYKAAEYEGRVYGLSAFTGVFGFERNCEVVIAAGLDCDTPPTTWEGLLDHARIINEQGGDRYYGYSLQGPVETSVGGIFRIAVFLEQAGVTLCRNECSEPYFNDPRAVPVMEFLRELNQYTPPGLTFNPDESQIHSRVHTGGAAYQIAGSWHPVTSQAAGCEDCRYSAVPLPPDGQEASIVVGNTIYAVLSQSPHPDIATEWVKFLVRDDVQALVYPALGRLPSTRSALTELRPQVDPAVQIFIDQLLNSETLGILPQWQTEPQTMWRIYNEMLTDVLTTDRPVQELMDEAQARAEAVLE